MFTLSISGKCPLRKDKNTYTPQPLLRSVRPRTGVETTENGKTNDENNEKPSSDTDKAMITLRRGNRAVENTMIIL